MATCTHCNYETAWRDDGLCYRCASLGDTASEAFSNRWIRCPQCLSFIDGSCLTRGAVEDGDQYVTCECGREFEVFLSVDVEFMSPPGAERLAGQ